MKYNYSYIGTLAKPLTYTVLCSFPLHKYPHSQDVVAPGLMVHSAKASLSLDEEETCALDSLGGTSMSAPAVAGAAALVRQYFSQGGLVGYLVGEGLCGDSEDGGGVYAKAGLCEAFPPSGYLVKAVLINSAMWLGDMQTVSYGESRVFIGRVVDEEEEEEEKRI